MRKRHNPPLNHLALAGAISSLLCGNALADTARYTINGDGNNSPRNKTQLSIVISGLQPDTKTSIYTWASGKALGEYCRLGESKPAWIPAVVSTPGGTILNGGAKCPTATAVVAPGEGQSFLGTSKKITPYKDIDSTIPSILNGIDLSAPLFDDVKVYVGIVDEAGQQKTEYAEIYDVGSAVVVEPMQIKLGEKTIIKTGVTGSACTVYFGDTTSYSVDDTSFATGLPLEKPKRYATCPATVEYIYPRPLKYTVKISGASGSIKNQPIDVKVDPRKEAWVAYASAYDLYKLPESLSEYIRNGRIKYSPAIPASTPPYSATNRAYDKTYMTTYSYTHDFSVSADAFTLEARIKNPASEGGINCLQTTTGVMTNNSSAGVIANFKVVNCFPDSFIGIAPPTLPMIPPFTTPAGLLTARGARISSSYPIHDYSTAVDSASGVSKDSNFASDFSDWRVVKLKVANKTIRLFYDGTEILSTPYTQDFGQITGLRQSFIGSGSMDWIKLYDGTDKLVYQEDFNE